MLILSRSDGINVKRQKAPERRLLPALPAPGTAIWSPRRKAAVVLGIRIGLITSDEAGQRYALSSEELATWEAAFDRDGEAALTISAAMLDRASRRSPSAPRVRSSKRREPSIAMRIRIGNQRIDVLQDRITRLINYAPDGSPTQNAHELTAQLLAELRRLYNHRA